MLETTLTGIALTVLAVWIISGWVKFASTPGTSRHRTWSSITEAVKWPTLVALLVLITLNFMQRDYLNLLIDIFLAFLWYQDYFGRARKSADA